jgi:4-hydroxy-tetrahydrodipicolinate synthase
MEIDLAQIEPAQFGDAQAAGIERLEDRLIAEREGRLPIRAVDDLAGRLGVEEGGERADDLGGHELAGGIGHEPFASLQKAKERPRGCDLPADGRRLVGACELAEPAAEEQPIDVGNLHPEAAAGAGEAEELFEIAPIGQKGVLRGPSLVLQVAQKALDRGGRLGGKLLHPPRIAALGFLEKIPRLTPRVEAFDLGALMASPIAFQGTFTALVTPFRDDGAIDFGALGVLVEEQIAGGITGLVPCGTTGETPTLSDEEQLAVIKRVADTSQGRVPIVAGTGSNDTRKTIAASKAAVEAGADAVMIVMPYYNKPSQDGMREHVIAVAREVSCPIVLYNIPGRSVVDLAPETTEQICERAPNVVAMKEATGNILRCQELVRRLGDRLAVMSGDDALTLGMMATGATGVISVSSNVLPKDVAEVTTLIGESDYAGARRAHARLLPFHGAMFLEPNPAPAKAALSLMGRMRADVRLPLVRASEAVEGRLHGLLSELGVL